MLTGPEDDRMVATELGTSSVAATAPVTGGFSMPLRREAGSGNAPACPHSGSTSRHQGGPEASLAASRNAGVEADPMSTPASQKRPRGLREWRHALGLSQADLAAMMRTHQTSISLVETGKCRDPERVEETRQALLDVARERLSKARCRRQEHRIMQAVETAWAGLPDTDRQKLVYALYDLAWFKLDHFDTETADAIGSVMPSDSYRALLDEYFDDA